jgi:hypothetical protein
VGLPSCRAIAAYDRPSFNRSKINSRSDRLSSRDGSANDKDGIPPDLPNQHCAVFTDMPTGEQPAATAPQNGSNAKTHAELNETIASAYKHSFNKERCNDPPEPAAAEWGVSAHSATVAGG